MLPCHDFICRNIDSRFSCGDTVCFDGLAMIDTLGLVVVEDRDDEICELLSGHSTRYLRNGTLVLVVRLRFVLDQFV